MNGGFVTLKIGLEESLSIVLRTLEANEAKGRRKFVRASCKDEGATFVLQAGNVEARGTVEDISAMGMAVQVSTGNLPEDPGPHRVLLRLKGVPCSVLATVIRRAAGANVIMFARETAPADLIKVQDFVFRVLQAQISRRAAKLLQPPAAS